jgi:hypothetical protein
VSSAAAGLIDANLASGVKSGYQFAMADFNPTSTGVNTTYAVTASPVTPNVTGQRYFCTDPSGVIQWNAASITDTVAGCQAGNTPI